TGVGMEPELDSFDGKGRERLLLRRLFFQLGVFDVGVAEEEFEEIILPRHRRRYRMIQSLRGGEIPLLDAATAGAPGSAALPSAESASSNADARDGLSLLEGVSRAPEERATKLVPQPFRPIAAEVDDGLALHVLAGVIIVIGERRVEAVAEELDLIHTEAAFAADIFRKSDALAIFES